MTKKPYQKFAWFCTFSLLTSSVLAAFNIYPYYVIGFIFSSTLWTVVSWLWNEKSLIVVNGGLTLIYVAGLIAKVLQ